MKNILDLSTQYQDVMQRLNKWIPDVSDRLDNLSAVGTQPEVIAEQKKELAVSVVFIITLSYCKPQKNSRANRLNF